MSECVVRMEMPNECPCELWHNCNPYIKYSMTILDASMERFPRPKPLCKGCRIICQLPEGHGRLVDADELKAKQQEDADLFINAYTLMEKSRRDEALNAVANIVNATTIVPAERSKTCG